MIQYLSRIDREPTNTTARLYDLRGLMSKDDLAAFIVPIDDEGRLAWISGFTGSNGKAIITLHKVLQLKCPAVSVLSAPNKMYFFVQR